MLRLTKTRHAHHVDRAGFKKLRLAVLPQLAHAFFVVDAVPTAVHAAPPEKIVERHHGERAVRIFVQQPRDYAIDVLRGSERRGALQEHEHVRDVAFARLQFVEHLEQR
jgi:hypothetical protein